MEHKRLIFSICAGVLLVGCTADAPEPKVDTPAVQTKAATGAYGQFLDAATRDPQLPLQKAALQNTLKTVRALPVPAWSQSFSERMVDALLNNEAFKTAATTAANGKGAAFGESLLKNPRLAGELQGANVWFTDALTVVNNDATAVRNANARYKNAAYRKKDVPAVVPAKPLPTSLPWVQYTSQKGEFSMAERVIAVAAARHLGVNVAKTQGLLAHPAVNKCLQGVQMNIDQCNAASHDQYDSAFCVAEHVQREPMERCFGWILP